MYEAGEKRIESGVSYQNRKQNSAIKYWGKGKKLVGSDSKIALVGCKVIASSKVKLFTSNCVLHSVGRNHYD